MVVHAGAVAPVRGVDTRSSEKNAGTKFFKFGLPLEANGVPDRTGLENRRERSAERPSCVYQIGAVSRIVGTCGDMCAVFITLVRHSRVPCLRIQRHMDRNQPDHDDGSAQDKTDLDELPARALARAEAAILVAEAGCDALAARVAVADAAINSLTTAARVAGVRLRERPKHPVNEHHVPRTTNSTSLEVALREALRGVVRDELDAAPKASTVGTAPFNDGGTLLTFDEVATFGKVDSQTVRGWIRSGKLRVTYLAGSTRLPRIKSEDWRALVDSGFVAAKRLNVDAVAEDIIRRRRTKGK